MDSTFDLVSAFLRHMLIFVASVFVSEGLALNSAWPDARFNRYHTNAENKG